MNMGEERIFPLKIYCNFNTSKYLFMDGQNILIPISRHVRNHFSITHVHPNPVISTP
jgi:hypothetical protein